MELINQRNWLSPLFLLLVYFTCFTSSKSHHIRHHRDRFKRHQGAHLYLTGSYVTDGDEPDAGPWLDWSTPSSCTRTCGGGVSTQHRQCAIGHSCRGSTKRHFSCNTQDCPDIADFRAQQCSEFDRIPFEGVTYQWIPYTKAPNSCELNCMPKGERFYYRHKQSVIDGTRCNDEKMDVCVDGKCQPVGCDMMLGSDAREDRCRVCDGDGSSCNTFTGVLDMQDLQVGYNDVLLLPAGSVNIRIREVKPSNNYLAVRNTSGYYYLNGNWRIDFPRPLDFAGTKFTYERYPQGFSAPDSIWSLGPTEEPLYVVLLYQDVNVGIHYEYSVPKKVQFPTETETYAWTFDEFTPCTASCGGGYQTRNVSCAGRKSLDRADPSLCDANNKPVDSQRCNEDPCEPRWIAKPWEKCSQPCGDKGVQTRQILCEQVITSGVPSIVDEKQCAGLEKPPTEQSCNQGVECALWHTGPWKPCDRLCGKGKERRKVTCYRKIYGKIETYDDSECSHEEKPESEKSCTLRPCEGVDWVTSEWSGCENKCGLSEETRQVQCATAKGEIYSDKLCEEEEEKPKTIRKCESKAKGCEHEWYASQWSECSAKCGSGVQTRKVFCTLATDDGFKKVTDGNCDLSKKYNSTKECKAKEEVCPGEWFTGPWSKCSKDCGRGVKTRKVICMKENENVPVTECDSDLIPLGSEECNKQACDKDEVLPVDVTKPIEVTEPLEVTEPSYELLEEFDYEVTDDEECEDGEWIEDVELIEGAKIGPSREYLHSLVSSLGESSIIDEESTDSTLASDGLMLSDAAYSDSGDTLSSDDFGSGDHDTTAVDLEVFDTEDEGSGDGRSTIFEDISTESTTQQEDDTTGTVDVTTENVVKESSIAVEEYFIKSSAYTVGSSDKIDTDSTTISADTSTDSVDVTENVSTTEISETEITKTSEITVTSDSSQSVTEVSEASTTTKQFDASTTEIEDMTLIKLSTVSDITTTLEESTDKSTEFTEQTTDITKEPTDVTSDIITESDLTKSSLSTEYLEISSTTEVSPTSVFRTSTEYETTITEEETSKPSKATETTKLEDITLESVTDIFASKQTESTTEPIINIGESVVGIDDTEKPSQATDETATELEEITEILTTTEEKLTTERNTDITEATTEVLEASTKKETETTTEIEITKELVTEVGTETTSETIKEVKTVTTEVETEVTTEMETATTSMGITDVSKETTAIDTTISSEQETTTSLPESTEITKETTTDGGEITTMSKEAVSGIETTTLFMGSTAISSEITEEISEKVSTTTEPGTELTSEVTEVTVEMTSESVTETTSESVTETTSESVTVVTSEASETTELVTEVTTGTEYDIWSSTTEPGVTKVTELFIPKVKKCKRKKKPTCKKSEFGCCSDKITPAQGPFDKGCPNPKTCNETKYGCCEDGVSPATGVDFKGCPPTHCEESLFGCCPDERTSAEGNDFEGCPPPPPACLKSKYGCCKDNITEAQGPDEKGCEIEEEKEEVTKQPDREGKEEREFTTIATTTTTTEKEDCAKSEYGCCPDGISIPSGEYFKGCVIENCQDSYFRCCPDGKTAATGPNYKGCKTECSASPYGCCDDGLTPAHGYNKEGCCLSSPFGCCPDNIQPAEGADFKGCGCQYSPFKCCPDNVTAARGYNYEGCGCQHTQYGCCPDNYTPAAGEDYSGCQCYTFQFGCCPDGVTIAKGPHQQGCGCRNTEFGCCSDDETPAKGPNLEGCGCASTKYGCCLDGTTEAKGENFEGCTDIPENLQAGCTLETDKGTCRNYTVKWFYDTTYAGCSRFWYSGCGGNGNRYNSKDECESVCVEPQGKARCNLAKLEGPCKEYYPKWYYDHNRNQCAQFIYGGCLGNNNRFETYEECSLLCVTDSTIDACEQPKEEGPCRGSYRRWYYDKTSEACQEFIYGGCKGNNNNFPSETACKHKCGQPGRKKEYCSLPRAQGNCTERLPRWYYDAAEKRCTPFYYSGCEGNTNNFISRDHCEADCPMDVVKTTCQLAADIGECSNYTDRWYYNTKEKQCLQFYYGGCGGNGNNFQTEHECQQRCEGTAAETESPEVVTQPEESFKTEFCFLQSDSGPCRESQVRYFYDKDGVCKHFMYGGCQGNRNNFKSEEECRQNCADAQDTCELPKVVGPCNAEQEKWYYDSTTDSCENFTYGGCKGNDNRFEDKFSCEQQCKRGPLSVTQGPEEYTKPTYGTDISICYNSVDAGNCTDSIPAYYYDPVTQMCSAFIYTGCGGNANRYNSEEQCQRQCGRFRGQDVCSVPKESGPCRGYFVKYYYNSSIGRCEQFVYGGCEGSGNRFSTIQECQSICVTHEEKKPNKTSSEICRLPVDKGVCEGGVYKRWYFDDSRGECITFIYSGCGGNFNRFTSFQSCIDACKQYMIHTEVSTDVITSVKLDTEQCQEFANECAKLLCPYGVEAHIDTDTLCKKCNCHNPCKNVVCDEGSQCAIDLNLNRTSDDNATFIAVCRETDKPGECPYLKPDVDHCEKECKNDADCALDLICCSNGCGTACVIPTTTIDVPAQLVTTSGYYPVYTESPLQKEYYSPELIEDEFEPEVFAGEGDYATLKCSVKGNPTPVITWSKENILIDGREPRYRILLDGALQIISLYKTDSGIYLCTADNKIGQPIKKEIKLEVLDAENHPARVLDTEVSPYVIVSLGSPTILNCFAYGYPIPAITWWKEDSLIPFKTSEFTVNKDHSLLINSVRLNNLGVYTCQAYNGFGKAASWSVTVQALGPVYSTNPNDKKYMKYVVNAPEKPTTTSRPQYPYRPTRVPTYKPRYSLSYTPSSPRPFPPASIYKHTSPTPAPSVTDLYTKPTLRIVPVKANITIADIKYPVGSDINIMCKVDGHPTPTIEWYKDGKLINQSSSIRVIDKQTLMITNANHSESGEYRCEAYNTFSKASSTTPLLIEGRTIHPKCRDNPFFANCKLIVQAKFCTHKYYAKFCCRSCTEAGLLPTYGPHLESDGSQSSLQSNLV